MQHNKTRIADTWNNYKRIPFYGEFCAWLSDSAEKTSKSRLKDKIIKNEN
jgi:hypothetical protein